jgi:hypothetical protein
MRQLSPLTNLALACLSAVGLVASLALPWFAPAQPDPADIGSIEAVGLRIGRVFSSGDSVTSGTDAVGAHRSLLLIAAAAVIVLCVAMLLPALRSVLRDPTRVVALAAPGLTLFLAGESARGAELRWGVVVSVAVALFVASCAWHGSAARARRPVPAPRTRPAA